ncbi:MAG: dephospho-CoA kinase [Clostridium sp.]|uniref:dephospho-CoA kinase n=1 Tax=Clostridium sp. TaxID=1506 RepID=UPI003025E91B
MRLNKSILKVGLTGGIGCGKSTVSNIFKNNNIPVIDVDNIARSVLISHDEILQSIRKVFGNEYFDEDGTFLRRKMGALIFSNRDKKKEYEEILMPYIKDDIFNEVCEYDDVGEDICIIDAPTLIENNLHTSMDVIIVVIADEDLQVKRVMERDNYSNEEAILRINNQMSTREKCGFADFIIDNNGHLSETQHQVKKIISNIRMTRGQNGT